MPNWIEDALVALGGAALVLLAAIVAVTVIVYVLGITRHAVRKLSR